MRSSCSENSFYSIRKFSVPLVLKMFSTVLITRAYLKLIRPVVWESENTSSAGSFCPVLFSPLSRIVVDGRKERKFIRERMSVILSSYEQQRNKVGPANRLW